MPYLRPGHPRGGGFVKDSAFVVLKLIRDRDGACGTDFQEQLGMARYGARIMELRSDGYLITREKCTRHYHKNRVELYRLVGIPEPSGQVRLSVGTGR